MYNKRFTLLTVCLMVFVLAAASVEASGGRLRDMFRKRTVVGKPSAIPQTPGIHKDLQFPHEDMVRTYNIYLPVRFTAKARNQGYPVLFLLHGGGGCADEIFSKLEMNPVADQFDFIVVYPDGTGNNDKRVWNGGLDLGNNLNPDVNKVDDVGFIRELAGYVAEQMPVNKTRFYVTGLSNGAVMTHRLAAELPDIFAAAAPVAGTVKSSYTENSRKLSTPASKGPIPVIMFHGTADAFLPYHGGKLDPATTRPGNPQFIGSLSDAVNFWLTANRAKSFIPTIEINQTCGYFMAKYETGNAPVIAYTIFNGEHAWCKSDKITKAQISELVWKNLSVFGKKAARAVSAEGGM